MCNMQLWEHLYYGQHGYNNYYDQDYCIHCPWDNKWSDYDNWAFLCPTCVHNGFTAFVDTLQVITLFVSLRFGFNAGSTENIVGNNLSY